MSSVTEETQISENERGKNLGGHLGNGSESAYLIAIAFPPLLLLLLFVYGHLRESFAAAANAAELAELQSNGDPVENASLTEWFDRHTSKEKSQQWRDVLIATRGVGIRFGLLASNWVVDYERVVGPDEPWTAEPIASRYAESARPVFDAIDKLVADRDGTDPKPVWQPVLIEGAMTMLGELHESRDVVRLLANEFRVAVHQNDQDRALRAIDLIRGVSEAFDWNFGVISDLVYFQHRDTFRTLIRESLQFEFWTEPELAQLKRLLSKGDSLDNRWHDSRASERAMTLVELSDEAEGGGAMRLVADYNLFPFGLPATTESRVLEIMRGVELAESRGNRTPAPAAQWTLEPGFGVESSSSFTITGIPFATAENVISLIYPSLEATAAAYVRDGQRRRWTRTAVAIKQFRLLKQRWPRSLSELASAGLSESEWMAIDSLPFGYQIDNESDQAILWTATPVGFPYDAKILSEPPSTIETDPERLEQWEVRISK